MGWTVRTLVAIFVTARSILIHIAVRREMSVPPCEFERFLVLFFLYGTRAENLRRKCTGFYVTAIISHYLYSVSLGRKTKDEAPTGSVRYTVSTYGYVRCPWLQRVVL